ncbi:MAG: YfhO family protein [Clostridiales bacterium]|nr:YfhO family protein [Clostridiales bacterium]
MEVLAAKKRKSVFISAVVSFAVVFIYMLGLFILKGFAPFGNRSLVWADANNDYVDFFAYYKDVLSGKSSLGYSFTKGLGGNMFGVLITGYFSPLNLIIVFFDKAQLNSFFDILVAIKVALAAFTMSWFLQRRFAKLHPVFVLCLSIAYGLCQYNIAQASNIFFLEGMYMLPLFMLGTYYIVKNDSPYLLIFSVAYNIMFSWYTGAFNCIFTVVWAVIEFLWYGFEKKQSIKSFLFTIKTFIYAAISGILISLVLFLPTIVCLGNSTEGSLEFDMFKDSNEFIGNIVTVLSKYTWNSRSEYSAVSLFCGCISLVCCVAFFFSSRFRVKQKALIGAGLAFALLIYYWKPLYLVFSLFKPVRSFWSRYGYIGIFVIIFIAALFLNDIEREKHAQKKMIGASVIVSAVILLFYKDTEPQYLKWIYATVIVMLLMSALVTAYIMCDKSKKKTGIIILASVLCVTSFEMCFNTHLLMNYYSIKDIDKSYIDYVENGIQQIDSIKNSDRGYYRITQTSTRNKTDGNLTANYDEGALLNYWCIESYTSVPDDSQREFLDRAGYRINGEDMIVANTSILPLDSLVGVKYVLSKYPIEGLIENPNAYSFGDKAVYTNPYALPMAFVTEDINPGVSYFVWQKDYEGKTVNNPFLYQNELFSQLVGRKVEIFKPVEYELTENNGVRLYNLVVSNGNNPIYGNFPWAWDANEEIYADGELLTHYARHLSPSVFYIPAKGDTVELKVTSNGGSFSIFEDQFYSADLELLGQISEELQNREVSDYSIRDGYAEFDIAASSGTRLFTSIPYDRHWTVEVNGMPVEPELFGDCLYTIPLNDGNNHVVMQYHIGGIGAGIAASVAGVLMVAGWYMYKKIKSQKNKTAAKPQESKA